MVTLIDTRPRHPEKANRPEHEMLRKPDWIRVRAPGSPVYRETQQIVRENNLVTVCEEAGCPNIGECWSKKHATMMIMGEICTRACAFCNVATGIPRRSTRTSLRTLLTPSRSSASTMSSSRPWIVTICRTAGRSISPR